MRFLLCFVYCFSFLACSLKPRLESDSTTMTLVGETKAILSELEGLNQLSLRPQLEKSQGI